MGLSAPRKRRKIGHDPNNTNWSRNDESFGHKILASQGWAPGDLLGAKEAAQSEHFSAANSSHIRVIVKDDNLGLGAKRKHTVADNFGIGALQDIYGRLNGKSEVVLAEEQASRADVGRRMYAEQRWGPARFVRGGYLVGDRIEASKPQLEQEHGNIQHKALNDSIEQVAPEKDPLPLHSSLDEPSQSMDVQTNAPGPGKGLKESDVTDERKTKKKRRSKIAKNSSVISLAASTALSADSDNTQASKEERRRRKEERRQRKMEKEARRVSKTDTLAPLTKSLESTRSEITKSRAVSQSAEAAEISAFSTIAATPAQTFNNRNAVRQRFIKQKRMASMDPIALREILMLKS